VLRLRRCGAERGRSESRRLISTSIGQTFAAHPGERIDGSLCIVDLKRGAVVVPKVEFRKIAV